MVALITRAELQILNGCGISYAVAYSGPQFPQTAPIAGSCAKTSKGIQEDAVASSLGCSLRRRIDTRVWVRAGRLADKFTRLRKPKTS
jgi:hypothetical protein